MRLILFNLFWFISGIFQGIWFLVTHPIRFAKFAKEWKRFERGIDEADFRATAVAEAGLSRRERRAAARMQRKGGG